MYAIRSYYADRAIELAQQAGICLVGYVRGDNLNIYSHPERLELPASQRKIAGVV